ncbi:4-hydroxy-3-methylbut-2-enyl diphosphate reductase [subsurface metagenome]
MRVRMAGKLGYCFGVSQAIEKVVSYAEGGKVYTLGTLAHNEHVVQYLRGKGVEPFPFEELPPDMLGVWAKIALNAKVAITAHGAPPEYYERLKTVTNNILDCTCPIVRKAQSVVSQLLDGYDILIFGDPNHQEVKGLMGWAEGKVKFVGTFDQLFTPEQDFKELNLGKKVAVISQSTKIPADFADFLSTFTHRNVSGFEELRVFNTICPIVAQRIRDTENLASEVDIMFVVGSKESANTRNLETVCRRSITHSEGMVQPWSVALAQDEDQVGHAISEWYVENDMAFPKVGVTAGTSTPIEVVEKVVEKAKELTGGSKDSD